MDSITAMKREYEELYNGEYPSFNHDLGHIVLKCRNFGKNYSTSLSNIVDILNKIT